MPSPPAPQEKEAHLVSTELNRVAGGDGAKPLRVTALPRVGRSAVEVLLDLHCHLASRQDGEDQRRGRGCGDEAKEVVLALWHGGSERRVAISSVDSLPA
jgi:hypothetical protein